MGEPIPVNDTFTREQIEGLREDFKDFSKEMRALMRAVTDPVSGYVPRAEIDARFNALYGNMRWTIGMGVAVSGVIASLLAVFIK